MRRVTFLWPVGRSRSRVAPLLLVSLAGTLACASLKNVDKKTLPDGSYELTCRTRLSLCLVDMQESCADAGYDVIDAFEERKRAGPNTAEIEIVRSHARIRCRKTTAVFGGSDEPAAPSVPANAAPVAPAPPSSPPRVCQPGATQVCVGTGACQGGQQCLPDGSGFGACDCGAPPPAPISPENPASPASTTSPSVAPTPVPAPASTAPKPAAP